VGGVSHLDAAGPARLGRKGILLAMLACRQRWGVIALLAAGTLPPFLELRTRKKPTGVYVAHMGLLIGLLVLGWCCVESKGLGNPHAWWAILPLALAIMIRSGIAPFHCWMTVLFEHSTFGTALLFVAPMPGANAAVRLLFPIAPSWVQSAIGLAALLMAVYAAGMALAQDEAHRFFCYQVLIHSALVLVGMDTMEVIGLTEGLCV
jgi:NADH-quinone oxidoreductase subunit M